MSMFWCNFLSDAVEGLVTIVIRKRLHTMHLKSSHSNQLAGSGAALGLSLPR
jgi:hypothetical protein